MTAKELEINSRYVLQDQFGHLKVVTSDIMLKIVSDDRSKEIVLGRIIKSNEMYGIHQYEKKIKQLEDEKKEFKAKIMRLVKSNVQLLAQRTQENFLYNFRDLIWNKL